MIQHRVGVIMNGVTGRMGRNQHLERSILAIVREGGIPLADGEVIVPDPILVGRNPARLEALASESGVEKWTTDLDSVLGDDRYPVYFDAQSTPLRVDAVRRAVAAGRHVYCEKPTAMNAADALELYRLASAAGVKHGVVQDKLWLPGFQKLKILLETGFPGELVAVRGEFGYWVFDGESIPCQRPSWNYRREDGGGLIHDMFPHWRYLLDGLFGGVSSVFCVGATHLRRRWDEQGRPYDCTADDAAYATFRLAGGAIAHFNSSWAVRVRRDDLFTIQVDGVKGSAVAGLRDCWIQPLEATPRPVWNPDLDAPADYFRDWMKVPDRQAYGNAFRSQWERFLRHVVAGDSFPWDLLEGAKGVQLAEKGLESWEKGAWVDVPPLV